MRPGTRDELDRRRAVVHDTQPLWLDALEDLLRPLDIDIAAKTTNIPSALEALEAHRPDLLLADFGGGEPVDASEHVRQALDVVPEMKVIVLSEHDDVGLAESALAAGAVAYVVKTAHPGDVVAAVHQAFEHSVFFHPVGKAAPKAAASPDETDTTTSRKFTRRETEILKLVAEGYSNAELARMLWVSEQTVKFHLSNIYRKLDVTNRTEASRWAQLHGLLDEPRAEEPVKPT
ncbi:MAG TPA: response regulator transcription factor [Gaiellaceae bacterium]|nr:response regulator transcription factor [Gaiellaceae bacterium]